MMWCGVLGCITVQEAVAAINGRVMLAIIFAFGVSEGLNNDHTRCAQHAHTASVADFACALTACLCACTGWRSL